MCAIGGSRNSDTVKTQRINYVRQHLSISTRDPVILSMEVRGTQEIIIDTEGQRGTPCTVEAKTEGIENLVATAGISILKEWNRWIL